MSCQSCRGEGFQDDGIAPEPSTECPDCIGQGICPKCGEDAIVLLDRHWYDAYKCQSCGWVDDE